MFRALTNRSLAGATLMAASLLLNGCGHSMSSARLSRGGTLVFSRAADIQSLDPTSVFDNPSIWAQEQIYETLYTVTANGAGVRPWLATGYTLSADNRTWTFKLRAGVRFSNGGLMRASDVAYSIDRARESKNGSATSTRRSSRCGRLTTARS